jgi:hypothetical protein
MHYTLHVDKSHQLGHAATLRSTLLTEYRDLKLVLGFFRTAPTTLAFLIDARRGNLRGGGGVQSL